jgi:hypothetical protein
VPAGGVRAPRPTALIRPGGKRTRAERASSIWILFLQEKSLLQAGQGGRRRSGAKSVRTITEKGDGKWNQKEPCWRRLAGLLGLNDDHSSSRTSGSPKRRAHESQDTTTQKTTHASKALRLEKTIVLAPSAGMRLVYFGLLPAPCADPLSQHITASHGPAAR